eukprot:7794288-Alexandrium_andersonii.AAC.1
MSASLVGSEMCIRDSPLHGALHGGHEQPQGAQAPPPLQVAGHAFSGHSCLLYTSDAADDM